MPGDRSVSTRRLLLPAIAAVARHPSLWAVGVGQAWRLRRRSWWRARPFLPLPDPDYLALRSLTAYGDPDRPPSEVDVVAYLRWCRTWPRPGRRYRTRRRDRVR